MINLVAENLTKEFPNAEKPLVVFRHCSFTVPASSSMAIVGPSGSGKSTLLSILGALDLPTEGAVLLGNTDITALSSAERTSFRRDKTGFIFQDHCLMPHLTAMENVLLPVLADRSETTEDSQRASFLLEQVGLSDRADFFPGALSGGQRQRVACVRALMRKPQLVLADEPTGNLDRVQSDRVVEILFELARSEGVILILATHDLQLAKRADHVLDLAQYTFDTENEPQIQKDMP
ncbi:MAG: ABC transporter ATP-binding protein [Planctomycetia bacterium]|nr:ABC transporter ATP-binding protein [Planctomycetia bacterium]